MYNTLIIPNYYLYKIINKDIEILYEIDNLKEDINLQLEAKIEYPQYHDNINITLYNDSDIYFHLFDKTSSFGFQLQKSQKYTLKLSPHFNSQFTNNTYFFIYFENQNLQELLFYKKSNLTYTTII